MLNTEYDKWKEIAKTGESAQLHNKSVVLKARRKHKSSQHQPKRVQEAVNGEINLLERKRNEVRGVEDRMVSNQRDDIHAFVNGHLSPSKLNRLFSQNQTQTSKEGRQSELDTYDDEDERVLAQMRQKRQDKAGKRQSGAHDTQSSQTQKQVSNQDSIEEDEAEIMDGEDLSQIHALLEKYDAVKHRSKDVPKSRGETDSPEESRPASAQKKSSRRRGDPKLMLPSPGRITTKADAYKCAKGVEKSYITSTVKYKPGLPKIERLKEIESQLEEVCMAVKVGFIDHSFFVLTFSLTRVFHRN